MLLKVKIIYFFFILLIILLPAHLHAQIIERDAAVFVTGELKDSVKVSKGHLISFKDTLFTETDTLIIRKEVWVREKDSLVLQIDTLTLQGMDILFTKSKIFVIRDTLLILEDTIISRNERVLRQIKEFSEKDNFFASILKNILVFEKEKTQAANIPTQNSDKNYEPYEGKRIRNIDVKVLDVFGYSMNNPESRPRGFLEKGGNLIHLKSPRWLIRNRLLFRKGDRINSLKVSESERLLRDNSYIYDAKIMVLDTFSEDSVDVQVIVQDVWSISVAAGIDFNRGRYDVGMRDVNFLGLGQTLDARLRYDPSAITPYNYSGAYTIQNISRSFITGRLFYINELGSLRYGAQFNREFISPAIKWAGGANLSSNQADYEFRNGKDSLINRQPINLLQGDYWLGYGINISGPNSEYKGSRIIMTGRFINNRYYERPVLPDSMGSVFVNNNFYLGSIGVIRTRYYKDSYIFRFGRTEDIPEGDLFSITAGINERFFDQRPYLGFNMAFSRYTNWGYLYSRLSAGSFYQSSNWKEGVGLAHLLYFSPLINLNKWKWRHFVGFRYTRGINPLPGSYVYLNQEQGVRGFKSLLLRGTAKVVVNYEMNLFPPLNLLGLRMAMVAFADLAWIGNRQKVVDKRNFFPGYGLGIRFRNDHLIFSTIQVLLGFYPNSSQVGEKEVLFFERSRFYYNFYDLQFSRPSQIPFL